MTDDMNKRRDQQAKNHVDYLTTELVHSFPFTHIEHAYCKGFDDGKAEMQAQVDELKEIIKGDEDSADISRREFNALLEQENSTLKAQLELAVSGYSAISDYVNLHRIRQEDWDVQYLHAIEEKIKWAVAQINQLDKSESMHSLKD